MPKQRHVKHCGKFSVLQCLSHRVLIFNGIYCTGGAYILVEMKSGCDGKGEFRDDVMFSSYSLSLILLFVLKEVLATMNSIMQRERMFDAQWYSLSTGSTPPQHYLHADSTPHTHHYLHAFGLGMLYYIQIRLSY